ncbi:MAG TPA: FAD-binding protein [Sphingomonas sp.]|nr:FAD-binding protein [Sphingomonas sp.]
MSDAADQMRPGSADELRDCVADAAREGSTLSIRGGGSKALIGAPAAAGVRLLDMSAFAGVVDYDPAELVLTVGAATPLAEVEALVAESGQMLAFEPFDHGPILGLPPGAATIGGVIAAGVAGSQRVSHGGARDHLLGFEAVSGLAQRFVAGARVVKNVTGYDLPKLAAGSWGRLFAMTQLTLKVLPGPRQRLTKLVEGLDFAAAQQAMAAALGSQADVAAAAYLPARAGFPSITAIRIQGFGPSVAARAIMLDRLLAGHAPPRDAPEDEAAAFWRTICDLDMLDRDLPLWRINVAPSRGPEIVAAIEGAWLADWGGGLIWAASAAEAGTVRDAAEAAGGHATLVRADASTRAAIPAFHPQPPGIAALEVRIRRAFDPAGVFETGRFA